MASEAAAERLGVKSLCEAFQNTAAARPGVVAMRVPGGRGGITWAGDAGRDIGLGAPRGRREWR